MLDYIFDFIAHAIFGEAVDAGTKPRSSWGGTILRVFTFLIIIGLLILAVIGFRDDGVKIF